MNLDSMQQYCKIAPFYVMVFAYIVLVVNVCIEYNEYSP